jgi:membrane-associated phospholipid phosphatase
MIFSLQDLESASANSLIARKIPEGAGPPARVAPARAVVEVVLAALGALVFLCFAAAFARGGQVVTVDDDVSRWVGNVPGGVEWAARVVTRLGGTVGTAIVAGIAVVVLWRASRRADAMFVALGVLGITALVAVLKAIYERARPELGSPIPLPHSYSFPSGHAATAVVLYGALGLLAAERSRSPLRAVAWLATAAVVALAIGASRVLLNVHFVSDVAAGFAVGLAWLCCCASVREFRTAR